MRAWHDPPAHQWLPSGKKPPHPLYSPVRFSFCIRLNNSALQISGRWSWNHNQIRLLFLLGKQSHLDFLHRKACQSSGRQDIPVQWLLLPCQKLLLPHHPWFFQESHTRRNLSPAPDGYVLLKPPNMQKAAPDPDFQCNWLKYVLQYDAPLPEESRWQNWWLWQPTHLPIALLLNLAHRWLQ